MNVLTCSALLNQISFDAIQWFIKKWSSRQTTQAAGNV